MLASTPVLAAGSCLVGAGATIAAIYFHRDIAVGNIGLVVVVVGSMVVIGSLICRALRRVNRPADVAFDEGYEMGFAAGYRDARRNGSPVLVALPSRRAAADGA